MTDEPSLKPVVWIGSSHEDLREFPGPVQDHMGYALYVDSEAVSIAMRIRSVALAEQACWK